MLRQKDPGGEQKLLPAAHRVQAPCQNSEVLPVERAPPPRQQFHRQEEEAVRKDKAA
jgi:hypothetical protein